MMTASAGSPRPPQASGRGVAVGAFPFGTVNTVAPSRQQVGVSSTRVRLTPSRTGTSRTVRTQRFGLPGSGMLSTTVPGSGSGHWVKSTKAEPVPSDTTTLVVETSPRVTSMTKSAVVTPPRSSAESGEILVTPSMQPESGVADGVKVGVQVTGPKAPRVGVAVRVRVGVTVAVGRTTVNVAESHCSNSKDPSQATTVCGPAPAPPGMVIEVDQFPGPSGAKVPSWAPPLTSQ